MDNASDFGSEDSRFESWQGRCFIGPLLLKKANFWSIFVAQWITRLTTDQKIPGSNPGKDEVTFIYFWQGNINLFYPLCFLIQIIIIY